MSDHDIEQQIRAKGLSAPRITPRDVEDAIADEHYFTAYQGMEGAIGEMATAIFVDPRLQHLTFCVLELENGFTVTGESICVSPENFDAQLGRDIARENAVKKIWPLLGYALRDQLYAKEAA